YQRTGLPPGPIDSPGGTAIKAALHPSAGHRDWIYFVTVNPKTGLTKFTSSITQFRADEAGVNAYLSKHHRALRPMKAAVLGSPITHSLSPVLHRAAYQALSLTGWSYQAIECDTARLPGVLDGCGPGWAGLSLTMPLKRAVLPLLDH